MTSWIEDKLPDQTGKTVVVTGGNSGIGYEAARILASRGARVVLACRSADKAQQAVKTLLARHPGALVEVEGLDLSSLQSVREAAERLRTRYERIDVLCNNAGIMALPRGLTRDGFEQQFGTNHLGHFALTALLIDKLRESEARIVTVSSAVHHMGSINFDDLQGERSYEKWRAYSQSKLANLLFVLELQRRIDAKGWSMLSLGCHPGYAATNLQTNSARAGSLAAVAEAIFSLGNRLFSQTAEEGSWPTVYACAMPDVKGGGYYGPEGFQELWGRPVPARINHKAKDPDVARRLWSESIRLTGIDPKL